MDTEETRRRGEARRRLEARGARILLEDNHLLVVSKRAGLLSQGGPPGEISLVDLVAAYRQEAEAKKGPGFVGLVHRLDRNVSGCLVLAKTSKAASRLSAAFRAREGIEKTYVARVVGVPSPRKGELVDTLRRKDKVTVGTFPGDPEGQLSRLAYEVRAVHDRRAEVVVHLHTGRTHQIRAQFALAGHPLVGDPKYGGPKGKRIALHAWRLAFPHPVGGKRIEVEAPLPSWLG